MRQQRDSAESQERYSLASELGKIADRRLSRVFLDINADTERLPLTAKVVEALDPQAWAESPTAATRAALQRATKRLPAGSPTNATISWRAAAEILFGFDPTPPGDGRQEPSYKLDYVPRLERESGYVGATFKRHVTRAVREQLAGGLLVMLAEREGAKDVQQPIPVRSRTGVTPLHRHEYAEEIGSRFSHGSLFVAVHGEAGTGKTYLAAQVAERMADGRGVITLRAANEKLLEDDVVRALMTEGLDPRDWSDGYSRAVLGEVLSGTPRSAVVVVDDVGSEEMLWQIVPRTSRIPVIITTRVQFRTPEVSTIELHEFTAPQAREFVQANLGECEARVLESFIRLLGHRPLALAHAVLFIQETDGVTIEDLVDSLTQSVSESVDLVTLPTDEDRNLAALYRRMVSSIAGNEPARMVLDAFLAVSGTSGVAVRALAGEFLERKYGYSRVRFESGVRALAEYGLIRKINEVTALPKKDVRVWLSMHTLTCGIVREIRGAAARELEEKFLAFLWNYPRPAEEESNVDNAWVWTMHEEMQAGVGLREGWGYIMCIDQSTWVGTRIDGDNGGLRHARYEVHPHGLFKIDYRTGVKEELTYEEAVALLEQARRYNEILDERYGLYEQWSQQDPGGSGK